MDFSLDDATVKRMKMLRSLGRDVLRPLGLECDRQGKPLAADHPFFQRVIDMGLVRPVSDSKKNKQDNQGKEKKTARIAVMFAEEASYWDRGITVAFPGPGLGGPPIAQMGTPEQQERFLSVFRDGKPHWGSFGMTEPNAGSDIAAIATTCHKEGNEWVLNGAKTFISNVKRGEWCVIFATIDPKQGRAGHRVFVVEKNTPGFVVTKVEEKMGLKAYESCSLVMENCRIPLDNLLGGEKHYQSQEGFRGAMSAFNASRSLVAGMAIGVGRAAWDHARLFMKENYNLSRPIRRYRQMEERLVMVKHQLDAGRMLAWRGAWLLDQDKPNALEASMAKAYCPPVALEACRVAMEVLSDAGVRNDHVVEKLYRDVKAMDIVEGTQQMQRTVIARRLVNLPNYNQSHVSSTTN